MAVFTLIAFDIDGNVSTFRLKAKDATTAEALLQKQTAGGDEMMVAATLPGTHQLNCDRILACAASR